VLSTRGVVGDTRAHRFQEITLFPSQILAKKSKVKLDIAHRVVVPTPIYHGAATRLGSSFNAICAKEIYVFLGPSKSFVMTARVAPFAKESDAHRSDLG
jgi:hypothetical protein